MSIHYPATDGPTAEVVARTVGVAYDPWMQDWPLEVTDGERTEEFLSHYDNEQKPEHRLAIAELIVASLEDLSSRTKPSADLLNRIGRILKMYPHIIEYWSCPNELSDDEMFHITPWMRTL